ncbi:MAG: DASH family cryptochrome [Bacteroidia bacterium]
MNTAIVWFRNDLRIRDNAVLAKAIEQHEFVIPVYVFDDHYFGNTKFGFAKTGSFRAQFLIEAIDDLQDLLLELGGDLIIRKGDTAKELSKLVEEYEVDAIYAQKEVCKEEIEIEQTVEKAVDCKVDFTWTSTLFHPSDIPFSTEQIPDVFSNFRKKCEKYGSVKEEIESPEFINMPTGIKSSGIPNLADLGIERISIDKRAALHFKGGEREAWKRLNHYFWQTEELANYKYKRNGLLGEDYSSKFAAWLALGCISPVSIYHEVKRFESEIKKNQSTYWLVFELIWRDYFRYVCAKYGDHVFYPGGIRQENIKWKWNRELFEKWRLGETGVPFVDANMQELLHTGFMSNRGRQNVASFLVKDLGLDWRAGAEWFESQLVDYDVCSNYGNWNYVAGIGNDPRDDRYFDVVWQAKKYDTKAEYIKTWLPGLADASAEQAIEPWKGGLFPVDYPEPVVRGRFMK